MTQGFVTVVVPFHATRSQMVEAKLETLGNPANPTLERQLDAAAAVHFMSMIVVPARDGEDLAHLVIEVCADGHPRAALAKLANVVPDALSAVLEAAAEQPMDRNELGAFLESHRKEFRIGWPSAAGVSFAGTPGMTVERIIKERDLAVEIRARLDTDTAPGPALEKLNRVRAAIFVQPELKWAFVSEPMPLRGEAKELADIWWSLLGPAFRDFLWPLIPIPLLVFLYSLLAAGSSIGLALSHAGLAVLIEGVVAAGVIRAGYLSLRRQERADTPRDREPEQERMGEILRREDHEGVMQNHLAGVSFLKPGLLRRVTLRLALWLIGEFEVRRSPPGFLGRIGTIHFARWLVLPKTDKLVFLSNYDGSWQSYLEDFIARLRQGLSSVWSNTLDFPKTEGLFEGGAGDSARFKRWARRQQVPTRFWYSRYRDLTVSRIRTNAEIRHGFASALTEIDAARWLTLFGYPPPKPVVVPQLPTLQHGEAPQSVETPEIPTLVFGGLARLGYSHCLLARFGTPEAARRWLAAIENGVTYGEHVASTSMKEAEQALVIAFTCSGLQTLGLEPEALATFPTAFQQGMAMRSRALGDLRNDPPDGWLWGGPSSSVDALIMLYAETDEQLQDQIREQTARLHEHRHEIPENVLLAAANTGPLREAFGFRDGISQPVMRGSRRAGRIQDAMHLVEPGELVLGYRDNLLNVAPLPQRTGRDFGRNGSYLVVRQLAQREAEFRRYVGDTARTLAQDPRAPSNDLASLEEWVAARMMGRWKNGTSLVRHPDRAGTGEPDNAFLFGCEDPDGLRCPHGAHIRRANPRDSFEPGSEVQLRISNRHRILRVGRNYLPKQKGEDPGLLFMCVNADIERQFEFLQQTWLLGPDFHRFGDEIDPVLGYRGARETMTVPTAKGPIRLPGLDKFVTVRGGGYFFMPSRSTVRVLAG